jgi:transposase
MRAVTFSETDLEAIRHDRYHHPDPRVQRKMEVLWLKHHNLTHEEIAKLADVSRSTVQRCVTDYLEGGLAAVPPGSSAGPSSVLDAHRTSLEEYFAKHPPRSIKEAQHAIEQQTGIRRGKTQVRRFLKRLGMQPRKVAAIPVPPNSSIEDHARNQAQFVEEKLEPRLEEARAGKRQLFFVDAAHMVFAPFLGWVWCLVRWAMRAPSGRKRYNVLGALDAVGHHLIRVTNHSYINALAVCDLLRAVADASTGLPITMVLDNARYQKCALVQQLAASLNIELLYLPSYSPNLNLIERVWKFVKKQALSATYHPDYNSFVAAIDQCLSDLPGKHKADMDTLLTHNFQMLDVMPLLSA